MTALGPRWEGILSRLSHAFQPIVRFSDGGLYGFEALLRGWEEAGFGSLHEVFDRAFEDSLLYALDLRLREKAVGKLAAAGSGRAKLFYNVDNRLLVMPDYAPGNTAALAEGAGLSAGRIVVEVSERHDPGHEVRFDDVLESYKRQGFRVALDDFGAGCAGLKLLYRADPDIVKIDRYFVSGSAGDPRKAAFLQKIVGLAHLMGVEVVAEGIETAEEYRVCAGAGCDYAQGFYIARPGEDIGAVWMDHREPPAVSGDRRFTAQAGTVDAETVRMISPVQAGAGFREILSRFRRDPSISVLPVVDEDGNVAGAYRERDFREYVYSPYGISLLEHLSAETGGRALLRRPPVSPLGNGLAKIVELYGTSPDSGGVILTDQSRYAGIVEADTLLSLVAERELVEARDQNPLTRLPGNIRISSVLAERLADPGRGVTFAYYDFDNFKPFNDRYGFRNGDRVIMLFADILRSRLRTPRDFVGHLGGDDFFACLDAPDPSESFEWLTGASDRFAREVVSFYSAEDRDRGWILGKDSARKERRMGLLTVSLAAVHLPAEGGLDAEEISDLFAVLKREAKASPDHRSLRILNRRRTPAGPCGLTIR